MNIRFAVEEDYPKIYDLFLANEMIDPSYTKESYFILCKWLYLDHPTKKQYQLVVEHEGEIIGHYAMTPLPYLLGTDPPCFIGMGSGLVVDKEYRNGFTFLRLQQYYLKNYSQLKIDATFGLVVRPLVLVTHLKSGYKRVGELPVYVRPYHIYNIAKTIIKNKFILQMIAMASLLIDPILKLNFSPPWRNFKTEQIDQFPTYISEVVSDILDEIEMMAVRSYETLNWRFLRHPHHKYKIFATYNHKGQMQGYVVCNLSYMKGIKTLSIVDIVLRRNDWCSFYSLWKKVHQLAIANNVDAVATITNPQLPFKRFFQAVGLIKSPEKFTLAVHSNNKELLKKLCFKKWYITWFENDCA